MSLFDGRCRCALLALLALLPAAEGLGQARDPSPRRPSAAQRLVQAWDFEERDIHLEPVPIGWFRGHEVPGRRERPGFPNWNTSRLDDTFLDESGWSVMLPTSGGSTSLMLSRGQLPAIPQAEYAVFARIRTDGLRVARARVVARYLDAQQQPLEGGEFASEPMVSPGRWTETRLSMSASDEAVWIQLELQLLQPDQLRNGAELAFAVDEQDLSGAAWFDDLELYQVPRVELSVDERSNVVLAPKRPLVRYRVGDLTGEAMRAEIVAWDLDGRRVDEVLLTVPPGGASASWTPNLPRLGWYRVEMRLSGPAGLLAATTTDFVWASESRSIDDGARSRFGVIAERLPLSLRDRLPDLVRDVGTGRINLTVWDAEATRDDASDRVEQIAGVAERLVEGRQALTLVLEALPVALAEELRLERYNIVEAFTASRDVWGPYLASLLTRFGERVDAWQIGPSDAGTDFWQSDLPERVANIKAEFERLVPRPRIAMPWIAFARTPGPSSGVDVFTTLVDPGVTGGAIDAQIGMMGSTGEVALVLDPSDPNVIGNGASVIDLARRAIAAHEAGLGPLLLREPWDWRESPDAQIMPHPSLAMWRTLTSQLAERTITGRFPADAGATILIAEDTFNSPSQARHALIAWANRDRPGTLDLSGFLGDGAIVATDLFGNSFAVSRDPSDQRHRIEIGESPVFIEGIDLALVRFRAAMRLDPDFLEARAQRHTVSMHLENTFEGPIAGRIRLTAPDGWTISPRVIPFALPMRGTTKIPLDVTFGPGESAGAHRIMTEVELDADRPYPMLRMPLTLEIGLESLDVRPSYRWAEGANGSRDLLVSVMVTNRGDAPVTLRVLLKGQGVRTENAAISQLPAGASTIKRFRIEENAESLRGGSIGLSVREADGTGRVNQRLEIR